MSLHFLILIGLSKCIPGLSIPAGVPDKNDLSPAFAGMPLCYLGGCTLPLISMSVMKNACFVFFIIKTNRETTSRWFQRSRPSFTDTYALKRTQGQHREVCLILRSSSRSYHICLVLSPCVVALSTLEALLSAACSWQWGNAWLKPLAWWILYWSTPEKCWGCEEARPTIWISILALPQMNIWFLANHSVTECGHSQVFQVYIQFCKLVVDCDVDR